MPGWPRNRRNGKPAGPAVSPPARPRDDWRTLPPLPTVLRSPVTTVAAGAFSDSLSTWHDPSFLAPLSHHVDPDGPAGLVTGLARAPESPEPLTYHRDRPLPVAGGSPASLQRSVASWQPPSLARSPLMTASDPDLIPVPVHPVSAEPGTASTDLAAAADRRPEPSDTQAEPPASPAAPGEDPVTPTIPSTDAGQVPALGQASPGDWRETFRPPERPLVPDRGSGEATTQRQMTSIPPQTPPKRRLGLGVPLSSPPGGSPARAAPVPERPTAASAGWSAGSAAALEPARTTADSVQRALADRAGQADPGSPVPVPPDQAAPIGKPLTEAPLIGEISPASHALRPPITPPAAADDSVTAAASAATPFPESTPSLPGSTRSLPAQAPVAATVPSLSPAARAPVQRSVIPLAASPGHLQVRPPRPTSAPQSSADPSPAPTSPPDPRSADQPTGSPNESPVLTQRLLSSTPDAAVLPHRAEVAPLLGHRQPPRILDAPPGGNTGPRTASASPIPDTPPPAPVQRPVPASAPVQRSVPASAPVGRLDGLAVATPRGPAAGHREPPAGYPDPGAIAVARGLARREPDGSVVFDLGSASVPPDPLPSTSYIEPAAWNPSVGSAATVQRQEAAEPVGAPAPSPDSAPATTMPAPSLAPAPSATPPPGAAIPPLDELARQLFGPLTARLKAELRLDRERSGMLTDLRQ